MHINKNRMTSDAILVLLLKLLLLLGICSVGKSQMETNNRTETSVSPADFSAVTTRTPDQFLNSSVSPSATTLDVSTIKSKQTDFSTTQKVPSNSAPELSSTQGPLSSTTVESSNAQVPLNLTTIKLSDAEVPPSSETTKLSDALVPPSSTTATELSSTQVASSSQVPGLLQTTSDLSPTTSELPTTQETSNATAAPTTASFSLNAEDVTPSENASAVSLDSGNVTDKSLKTDKITEGDLSPMTTHSNEHYDVETTDFTSMNNATVSLSNDTNNYTSSDDSHTQGNEMTSLMTQPSDDATTMQSSTDMDISQTTQFFSSSVSSFLSSSTSSSSSSPSSSQSSLSSLDRDGPPQPQSQPQEMTFAAKVALVFGVMVGISCVIVVAIVSIRQLLGYWARRDYSNLAQDSMMPFS